MRILLFLLLPSLLSAQAYQDSLKSWQNKLNAEYADSATSPLKEADRLGFEGLEFFPVDSNYRVEASVKLSPESEPFEMATTTGRKARYRQYGIAHFTLLGDSVYLPVYQNMKLLNLEKYRDYLFLPFTDKTNGNESYGGGRYLSLSILDEGEPLIIDFNKAYNPYCAYNERYSCPIPPQENHLPLEIKAGVKAPAKH